MPSVNTGFGGSFNIPTPAPKLNPYVPFSNPGQTGASPYTFQQQPAPEIKTGDQGLDNILAARPGYQGITDPGGNLYGQFKINAPASQQPWLKNAIGDSNNNNGVTGDISNAHNSLGQLSDMASSSGMTPYGQAQLNQLDVLRGQHLDAARGAAGGATATAMDNVAMRGGLSGGAAERMQTAGALNGANAAQNVYAQDAVARAGVGAQDAGFKQNLLTALPGMEMASAGQANAIGMGQVGTELGQANLEGGQQIGVGEYNTGNAINSVMGANPYNQAAWTTGAQVYGSDQTANAMMAAANKPNPGLLGGGGFLGTGVGVGGMSSTGMGDFFGNQVWHPVADATGSAGYQGWSWGGQATSQANPYHW